MAIYRFQMPKQIRVFNSIESLRNLRNSRLQRFQSIRNKEGASIDERYMARPAGRYRGALLDSDAMNLRHIGKADQHHPPIKWRPLYWPLRLRAAQPQDE